MAKTAGRKGEMLRLREVRALWQAGAEPTGYIYLVDLQKGVCSRRQQEQGAGEETRRERKNAHHEASKQASKGATSMTRNE